MIKKYNLPIFILPLLIFVFGYVTLLSTSPSLVKNHLIYFLLGLVFYFLFSTIDYTLYKYLWKWIYASAIFLLIITLIFAEFKLGAARWLQIGPISFQTSEYVKAALIISLSVFISERKEVLNDLKNIIYLFLLIAPIVLLIFAQPDFGTSVVIALLGVGVVFYAGLSKYYMLVAVLVMGILSTPIWNILEDYQQRRILVFLNPTLDILGSGYNVIQSIIAVGSGGLLGKGFGRGTQANLQFLPAYWTDFIFASFAEEWGFLGVFLLVTLYLMLVSSLLYVAYKIKNFFGKLISIGVFFIFFLQFTINVGMNLGIMPVTGVTLPLVSYGGSSLLFSFILLGIIQNVWKKDMIY